MKETLAEKQVFNLAADLENWPYAAWFFESKTGKILCSNQLARDLVSNAEGENVRGLFPQFNMAALKRSLKEIPIQIQPLSIVTANGISNGQGQFTSLHSNQILLCFRSDENFKPSSSSYERSEADRLDVPNLSIEYFKDLFENATDLIQGIDRNGDLLYCNKSWLNTLGYACNSENKVSVYSIIVAEERDAFKAHLEDVVKGKGETARLWTLQAADGKRVLVESNENLRMEEGKPHSIRSIMRNVTATVEAEARAAKNKARIEAFFDSSSIMFWTVNKGTAITSFNKSYADTVFKLYGAYPEINEDLSKPKKRFASDEYHKFWDDKYRDVFENGQSIFFQTVTRDIDGNEYNREIYLNPIKSVKGDSEIAEIAGIAIDVSDRYRAEQQLMAQASQIKTIFEASNLMMWSIDLNGKLTSFNEWFEKCALDRFNTKPLIGESFPELAVRCGVEMSEWGPTFQSAKEGKKLYFEHHSKDARGRQHIEEISISPIVDGDGKVAELAIIAQTVTIRKAAEKILREQAGKINAIFDSTALFIYTLDREYRLVSYNKMFAQQHFALFGKEVCIGSDFLQTAKGAVKLELMMALRDKIDLVFSGKTQRFESEVITPTGRTRWVENFYNPIYGENDDINEISCLSFDITAKKEIERSMVESIKEKEVLLQEVHHRVKNNLQVISSILNLQSAYVKDDASLAILKESQNRIKSMSFIHESLYLTNDFAQIDFGEYLLALTKNLIHTYGLSQSHIVLDSDIDSICLGIDQAIPCGLIVNEIISNALKYAFVDRRDGNIRLSLKVYDEKVKLRIGDDGAGLPVGFDYRQAESLGLQLVHTLIEQLDGTIELDNEGGTSYLITFVKQ